MKKKILVLDGGLSSEREISKRSGRAIYNALVKTGFEAKEFDFRGRIESVLDEFEPDAVFIALHGKFGEDGTIQGMLELMGIPYTGSGVLASAVCMDKLTTKRLFDALKIKTPRYIFVRNGETVRFEEVRENLKTQKVVIKPVDQGSTIGITITDKEEEFNKGLERAFDLSETVIIEEFIKGKEITVSIIGNGKEIEVLPVIEIIPAHEYYDFESKYTPGMSKHLIPPDIGENSYKEAESISLKIYKEFGIRDFGRIDLIVDENEEIYALEANTIPGFTETSLLPDAAKKAGIPFEKLVEKIVGFALSGKR